MAERRVAGAEVVEGELARRGRAARGGWRCSSRVASSDALGDLQHEPRRGAGRRAQRPRRRRSMNVGSRAPGETFTWTGRAEPPWDGPALGLPAGRARERAPERHDQARLLGERDESGRVDAAARAGCCQRTSASTRASRPVVELDDGLVVDRTSSLADASRRRRLEPMALEHRHLMRLEQLEAALAALLGLVHGDVGIADQLLGRQRAGGPGGDAALARTLRAAARRSRSALGQRRSIRSATDDRRPRRPSLRSSDGELVAAQAGQRVGRAHAVAQARRRPR